VPEIAIGEKRKERRIGASLCCRSQARRLAAPGRIGPVTVSAVCAKQLSAREHGGRLICEWIAVRDRRGAACCRQGEQHETGTFHRIRPS
jgi:hypothetical protein